MNNINIQYDFNKEILRAMIDSTTAVIYLKDTQGRYIMINDQCARLFNITKDEIVGKTDYDIFPEEQADLFIKNDKKVLDALVPLEFEEVAPHDDGLHTYISLKFPLLNTDKIAYGVGGISTDITERKQVKGTARQTDKILTILQSSDSGAQTILKQTVDMLHKSLKTCKDIENEELYKIIIFKDAMKPRGVFCGSNPR